ncbi:F-box only protein 27 isoform X1 [Erinaceus europaeus]|uniref:F-box only protein 27 n=1 Tax=Erinaceus europaeus TaxID=9365 RepID=A0A1S2ZSX9_ERIEU|nr:F-box only protein 27 isoform X1 [Erinaceus europaeus]XP_060041878.1 F-box only protein 27 isoform X1 [Erinaceus europaeus]
MGASISRRVPGTATQQPEAERALDLSRLPPELLLLVLSHVPPRVLLGRCRRVCRGWRALVDGQALWLLILARDHPALLPVARGCLPPGVVGPKYLARFCVLRPMARNLIRNPCGQDGLQKWMVRHGGDGWLVEPNLTPVPGAPSQTCFASSFRWCSKKQVLDLVEEGFWPELLSSGKIEIVVSDWWGARHDCGCRYRLLVQLLDASHMTLDEFSAEPEPIEQWNNCASHHVTHVFSNIQKGLRFVSFQHWGQDTKFWAGHYGARVTNSSVIVRVCSSTPTDDC